MKRLMKSIFIFLLLILGSILIYLSLNVNKDSLKLIKNIQIIKKEVVEKKDVNKTENNNTKENTIEFKEYEEIKIEDKDLTGVNTVRKFLGIKDDGLNELRTYLGKEEVQYDENEFIQREIKKTFKMEITDREEGAIPEEVINSYSEGYEKEEE